MSGARIEDGDLLLVEKDEDPPDGAIVVALLRGGEEVKVQGRVVWVFYPPASRSRGIGARSARRGETVLPKPARYETSGREGGNIRA